MPRIALAATLLWSAVAAAQVPNTTGYQGRLLRSDGTAATGTASLTFAIFDAASGGSQLWTETQTLGLSDGYYATFLGLVTPFDGAFDGGARWLEVRAGSETLTPRQQIGAAPYALRARSVAGGTADVSSLKVGGATVVDGSGRLAGTARYSGGSGIAVDAASQTVSLQPCAIGQVLVHDGSAWQCATQNPGTVVSVSASGPLVVANGTSAAQVSMPQAGGSSSGYLSSSDWTAFNSKYGAATQCGGDLTGTLASPTVARLQSRAVAAAPPQNGQVLKWNAAGAQWEPASDADSGGTVTSLTAVPPLTAWNGSTTPQISMDPATAAADGYLASGDWYRFNAKYDASTQCGGDLAGTLAAPLVARLQGVAVSTSLPGGGQVMRYDGSAWSPASLQIGDVGGLSSGYLDLTGDQTIGGAKSFAAAPQFGSALGVASGGTGSTSAGANSVFAGPDGASGAPAFRALSAVDVPLLDTGKLASGTLGVERGGTGATAAAANSVFAGPDGAGGTPAFRTLAAADIPSLDTGKLTTGTLGVARGGTGATTFAVGGVLYGAGTSVGALAGTAGQVLVSGGAGAPSWTASPTLTGTNFSGIPQGSVTNLTSDLAARPAGTGTSGYHARWIGTSTVDASPVLYDDGTRVGVGTASPGTLLHLEGTGATMRVRDPSQSGDHHLDVYQAYNSYVTSTHALYLGVNGVTGNAVGILATGSVGIGTTTPGSAKLNVAGVAYVDGAVETSGGSNSGVAVFMGNTDYNAHRSTDNTVGIGNFSSSTPLGLDLFTANVRRMRVDASGNVGIGTNPSYPLDVAGDIRASGTLRGNGSGLTAVDAAKLGGLALFALPFNCPAGQVVTGFANVSGTITPTCSPTGVGTQQNPGTACWHIRSVQGTIVDGVYWIDPDGAGGVDPFSVYCDMNTDGGGWTLVDNDATNAATFLSRTAGANTSISTTRGAYLPTYTWSSSPQLLVKSSRYSGSQPWVTLNATSAIGKEYPTTTTRTSGYGGTGGDWSVAQLNGNTNYGTASWIYNGDSRFGSVWIGSGGNCTACCDYTGDGSGVGGYGASSTSTCSTWVR